MGFQRLLEAVEKPRGVYRWTDGSIYEGAWTDNVIDGAGAYVASDGRCFKGYWADRVAFH